MRRMGRTDVARTAITLLPAFVFVGGCAVVMPPRPEARVAELRFVERTGDGVLYEVEIEGANRSEQDLRLESVRYWLAIDGVRVFEAERVPQATFSSLGTRSFAAPIAIPVSALPAGESEYTLGATVSYRTPGPLAKMFYDLGLIRPRVGVREGGGLPSAPTPDKP